MYKKKFSLLVVESVSMETTATGHFPSSNWQNSEGKMIPSVCESVGEIIVLVFNLGLAQRTSEDVLDLI